MRQIKFRGKCVEEFHTHHEQTEPGQWLNGYLVDEKTITHKMSEEHGGVGPGVVTVPIEVDPKTVGQFTGLCDKNGKEVYEGDIVFSDSWNPNEMEVRFYEGAFMLYYEDCEPYLIDLHYVETEFEVIGSIHEDTRVRTL